MKRLLAALFLAASVGTSFAQGSMSSNIHVADPRECGPGSSASPNYKWQDGKFVRDGWFCSRVSSQ